MSYRNRECRECGQRFEPRQRSSLFCSTVCRAKWNNRRQARGAELYDFLMAEGQGSSVVHNLLDAYRTADAALRAGRPSYQDAATAAMNVPFAYGKGGDGR